MTSQTGTWTVTLDGGAAGTDWSKVLWNDLTPNGTAVVVSARAADTEAGLPGQAYVPVANGTDPMVAGRFIQVQARLNGNAAGDSPILYDLRRTPRRPS